MLYGSCPYSKAAGPAAWPGGSSAAHGCAPRPVNHQNPQPCSYSITVLPQEVKAGKNTAKSSQAGPLKAINTLSLTSIMQSVDVHRFSGFTLISIPITEIYIYLVKILQLAAHFMRNAMPTYLSYPYKLQCSPTPFSMVTSPRHPAIASVLCQRDRTALAKFPSD